MVYYPSLVASNKKTLRFQVDLSTEVIPVATTSNTEGLVLSDLLAEFKEKVKVTYVGIRAVTACVVAGSATKIVAYLQKNGGNNVDIPASGAAEIAVSGNAIAIGVSDEEIGADTVAKTGLRFSGATATSFKLVVGADTASTAIATDSGIIEVVVECEFASEGLPRG